MKHNWTALPEQRGVLSGRGQIDVLVSEDCMNCEGCTSCIGCIGCEYCTRCVDCIGLVGRTGWVDNKPPA